MGKGKVNQATKNPAAKSSEKLDGCICPSGCMKREPINPEDPTNVLMKCSTGEKKCTACKLLHAECYEDLELKMIRVIQSSSGRTRDWTYEQCRRFMWGRLYDLIFKFCKCICGGSLVLDEDAQLLKNGDPGDEDKAKKKKIKAHKELPKLVVDTGTLTGTSSYHKVLPKVKQPSQPPIIKSVAKIEDQFCENKTQVTQIVDDYIPGLVVRDKAKDKNAVKQKTEPPKHVNKPAVKVPTAPPQCKDQIPSLLDITFTPIPQFELKPAKNPGIKEFEPLLEHCYVNFDANLTKYADLEVVLRKLMEVL